MAYDTFEQFRCLAHIGLGSAKDATFELIDAVLGSRHVYRFSQLHKCL